jgi:hypothetical protein
MKAIISREEKVAKKRFITLSFQGLKKVAKFFSRLIQYAAECNKKRTSGKKFMTQGRELKGQFLFGVRAFGLRKARYTGLAKVQLQHILSAAAINVVRMVAWLQGMPHAKTRIS